MSKWIQSLGEFWGIGTEMETDIPGEAESFGKRV